MSRFRSSISLKGPFFTHDPAMTFQGNLRVMLGHAADEAVQDVQGRMRDFTGDPIRELGGHSVDHVGGGVNDDRAPWVAVASIRQFGNARQATSLMAAASTVETRTHAFRRMTARMRASRAVNRAELLRGIQ